MDERTFDNLIPYFLKDQLDNKTLAAFLDKISDPACADELSVQYLVLEGLQRLEDGDSFNLDKDLSGYVAQQREHLHYRRQMGRLAYTLECITLAAVGICVALLFRYLL